MDISNTNSRTEIQRILQDHFPDLSDTAKKAGWLNQIVFEDCYLDPHKVAIKLGRSLEPIMHAVAKLRYPGGMLPRSIAGHGVNQDEADDYFDEKYEAGEATKRDNAVPILTRLNVEDLAAFVSGRLEAFYQQKKIKTQKSLRYGLGEFLKLSNEALAKIPCQKEITELSVDMCLLDQQHTVMELKSTFDTDNGKTQHELAKLTKAFIALGNRPKNLAFGVISNNRGFKQNGEWSGGLGTWVSKDLILVEEKLWAVLGPKDVPFRTFIELFHKQFSLNQPKRKKVL